MIGALRGNRVADLPDHGFDSAGIERSVGTAWSSDAHERQFGLGNRGTGVRRHLQASRRDARPDELVDIPLDDRRAACPKDLELGRIDVDPDD